MPFKYWVDAILTATFLINRLPSPALNFKTPYELLFHIAPDYTSFRVFGCTCFPWLLHYRHSKLEPKSRCCAFLGYSSHSKGYRCLNVQTYLVFVSRHVQFVETEFPFSTHFPSPTLCSTSSSSTYQLFNDNIVLNQLSSSSPSNSVFPPIVDSGSSSTESSHDNSATENLSHTSSLSPSEIICNPSTSVNTHTMLTRSKKGISKPKAPFNPSAHIATDISSSFIEPPNFQIAFKSPT